MAATNSNENATPTICKIEYNGDIRRFQLQTPSYARVVKVAMRRFELSHPANVKVVFTDPEGDVITVTSDRSLEDAMSCQNAGRGQPLRLSLVPATTPLPVPEQAGGRCRQEARQEKQAAKAAAQQEKQQEKIQRKIQKLQAVRGRIAAREQFWAQQVATGVSAEVPQQRISAHLAKVEARAQKLAAKFPEHAAAIMEAVAKPVEPAAGPLRCPFFMGPGGQQRAVTITCDGCHKVIEMSETRYNCEDCPDYDLCAACEANGVHDASHILRKMRPEGQATHPRTRMGRPCFGRRFGRFGQDQGREPLGPPVLPVPGPLPFFAPPHHPAFGHHHHQHPFFGHHHHQHPGLAHRPHGFPQEPREFHPHPPPHMGGRPFRGARMGFSERLDGLVNKLTKVVEEQVVPLVEEQGWGVIPVVAIAKDLLQAAREHFPGVLFRLNRFVDRHLVAVQLQTTPEELMQLLSQLPPPPPAVVRRAAEVLREHVAAVLPTLLAQMATGNQQLMVLLPQLLECNVSDLFDQLLNGAAPVAEPAPAPAPAPTPAEPEPEPTVTASTVLAALSVPADIMAQILQQADNDPAIAAALWQAMQE
jgi:hypothetical protein